MRRLWIAGLAAVLGSGCLSIDVPLGRGGGPLQERLLLGRSGPKILMIDVAGSLSERGERGALGLGGSGPITSRVRAQLELAALDDEVGALLLRVNSPGGTVTASEIVYGEILRFKQEHEIPVIVQMMGVAASGGYYIAMTGDHVQAYPTTVTGSIGVIFAGVELSGLMDKVGVANQTLVTGSFKDAGSPLRPLSEPEREQLSSVIEDLFGRFLDVVETGRPELSRDRIEALADGRIYSASQALDVGLVDSLGDLESAVDLTKEKLGVEKARLVVYRPAGRSKQNLFSVEATPTPGADAQGVASLLARPGFLYLWSAASP